MSDDKVVQAFPGLPENPLQIEKNRSRAIFCQHDTIRIDAHERTIICANCQAVLDPFNFVLSNAITISRAWENYKQVTGMVSELNDRVAFLKKEEQRLRAQVKRLQDKTGDVVQVRGKKL